MTLSSEDWNEKGFIELVGAVVRRAALDYHERVRTNRSQGLYRAGSFLAHCGILHRVDDIVSTNACQAHVPPPPQKRGSR